MKTRKLLGKGILNWGRGERITDRYGAIFLMNKETRGPVSLHDCPDPGTSGRLVVRILEQRESDHIGDLMRGFFPETPALGEEILLGEGTVFFEEVDEYRAIGLKPDDGREFDWLDPKKLYRTHCQVVSLFFEIKHL